MTKITNIYPGFAYKDLVSGKILTVFKVDDNLIEFDNGLTVSSLDAFELFSDKVEPKHLQKDIFEVKEGKLFRNGKSIETGTLYIEEILFTDMPRIVLAVRSLGESFLDLFIYNVVDDKFYNPHFSFDSMESLMEDGDVVIYKAVKTNGREGREAVKGVDISLIPKGVNYDIIDGDSVLFPVSHETYLVFVDGFLMNKVTYEGDSDMQFIKKVEDDYVIVSTLDTKQICLDLFDDQLPFDYPVEIAAETTVREVVVLGEIIQDGDSERVSYNLLKYETTLQKDETFNSATMAYKDTYSLVVLTDKGFIYTNNGYNPRRAMGEVAKEAIKSHPYLVTLKPGNSRNTFVLANDAREVIELEVTKTHDRGYVTKVLEK